MLSANQTQENILPGAGAVPAGIDGDSQILSPQLGTNPPCYKATLGLVPAFLRMRAKLLLFPLTPLLRGSSPHLPSLRMLSTSVEGFVRKPGVSPPADIRAFVERSNDDIVVLDARNTDFGLEPGDAKSSSRAPIAGHGGDGYRPKAVNIPFNRATKSLDVSLLPGYVSKDSFIITHCGGGGRGQKSKEYLKELGYRNVINGGGPDDEECWKEFGEI